MNVSSQFCTIRCYVGVNVASQMFLVPRGEKSPDGRELAVVMPHNFDTVSEFDRMDVRVHSPDWEVVLLSLPISLANYRALRDVKQAFVGDGEPLYEGKMAPLECWTVEDYIFAGLAPSVRQRDLAENARML